MGKGTALVTGGHGFIGRHLVNDLVANGYWVKVIDLAPTPTHLPDNVQCFQGSVLDERLLKKAMDGVDYVFHLAANPNLWAKSESDFLQINYKGTKKVLSAAQAAGVKKVVYTSTEAILKDFRNKSRQPITEDMALPDIHQMAGPYTRSKWNAEKAAFEFLHQGLPVVIVYPTTPVGGGDVNLTPPTQMILDFLKGNTPAFLECYLNLIHVKDVAKGHLLALEKGEDWGAIYSRRRKPVIEPDTFYS